VTGARFLVVNTHWDHESQAARENSARLMMHRLSPQPDDREALLVLGDFNCSADNPAFRMLEGASAPRAAGQEGKAAGSGAQRPQVLIGLEPPELMLADTFTAMFPRGVAGSGTYHAFRGNRDGARIDFVLVWPLRGLHLSPRHHSGGGKEWRVLQADIVHTSENGRYPSDHFPVTATLLLTDVEANVTQPLSMTDSSYYRR
jgi:endonuclease/exonuclease/phosphatase family metal-dependent hydrolase